MRKVTKGSAEQFSQECSNLFAFSGTKVHLYDNDDRNYLSTKAAAAAAWWTVGTSLRPMAVGMERVSPAARRLAANFVRWAS